MVSMTTVNIVFYKTEWGTCGMSLLDKGKRRLKSVKFSSMNLPHLLVYYIYVHLVVSAEETQGWECETQNCLDQSCRLHWHHQ